MFERDLSGQPVVVADLDADWVLAMLADKETSAREAERGKLRLAAQWCVLHPATAETGAATWADSGVPEVLGRDEAIGGDGTPAVAAFAAEPFAAALQISTASGMQLLADALNLQHRLPRIWARVESLEVAPWRARRIAQATASLSRPVAAHVDAALAERAGSCGAVTIDRAVEQAIAECDPEAQAERERRSRRTWGVRLAHGDGVGGYAGTSWLEATGDSHDLTRFHDLVCAIAAGLGSQGDSDDLEVRKARALGVIADSYAGGPAAPAPARTRLYLHASLADLRHEPDSTGVGQVERLGPATVAMIREWVGHSRVSIRPVLDLTSTDAVDEHDPPAWLRELVLLRDRRCVFPWCTRDSRTCDLDHIDPYDELGPPGQTHPGNLAPLCRRHHRLKTSGRWRYRRDDDGTYTWRSPHDRAYTVTPTGSITLG